MIEVTPHESRHHAQQQKLSKNSIECDQTIRKGRRRMTGGEENILYGNQKFLTRSKIFFSIVVERGRMQTQRYPREKTGRNIGDAGRI